MEYDYRPPPGPAPIARVQDGYVDKLRLCNMKMFMYLIGVGWGSISYGYGRQVLSLPNFLQIAQQPVFNLLFYIFDIGGIFGALTAGFLCDAYGRKPTIMIGAAVTLIATGIMAASIDLAMFMVFRFLVGFGTTVMLVAIPVWITEVAPPKGRAILTSTHPILILLGTSLPAWITLPFFEQEANLSIEVGETPILDFRAPTAVGCLWPFLCLLSLLYVPESPRYLLRMGKEEKAWEMINDLHSRPEDRNSYYTQLEFARIKRQTDEEKTSKTGFGQLWSNKSSQKRVIIACLLNLFVPTSGINVISVYDFDVYEALGLVDGLSYVLRENAWLTAFFGMSFFGLFFVERIPRRCFIILGFLGCFVAVVVQMGLGENLSVQVDDEHPDDGSLVASIAMTYLFAFFYANFLFSSTFFYAAEIFPNYLRAKGMAVAMLVLSLIQGLWVAVSSYGYTLGWQFFIVFVVFDLFACLPMIAFPDTRQMPLEDIGQLFGDYGAYNHAWTVEHPSNSNVNPQMNQQPSEMYYNQRQFEMGGYQRQELHGIHPAAEAASQSRYEMPARSAPVESGGQDIYEAPDGTLNRNYAAYGRWG